MDLSRISLRRFKLSDADDFLKWSSDEKVATNLRWNPIKTIEEALHHLEKEAIPHQWHHSICYDDRSIGYIAVWKDRKSDYEKHIYSIGYAVASYYWGQGIATLALKMALNRVFEELPGLVRLEGFTLPGNIRSQRVLEKVGFQREGLFRKYADFNGEFLDICVFSFLSTDQIL